MAEKPTVWVPSWEVDDPSYGVTPAQQRLLKELFNTVTYQQTKEDASVADRIGGAVIIGPRYDRFEEQLPLMNNLKIVANFGVGYNRIDLKKLKSRGIVLSNTPDVLNAATADMAMALLLASARDLYSGVQMSMARDSAPVFSLNLYGVEVTGATLGIVGLGRIGLHIARRARAFDMNILYHNRNRRSCEDEALVGATYYASLHQMLGQCDFVVIACPLTADTRHLIGADELRAMKASCTLVNIARGAIIDHIALASALQSGEIRAAALDVTDPEPLPRDHALLRLDNVIITPHSGSATFETRLAMMQVVVDNLRAVLIQHTTPPNLVQLV